MKSFVVAFIAAVIGALLGWVVHAATKKDRRDNNSTLWIYILSGGAIGLLVGLLVRVVLSQASPPKITWTTAQKKALEKFYR